MELKAEVCVTPHKTATTIHIGFFLARFQRVLMSCFYFSMISHSVTTPLCTLLSLTLSDFISPSISPMCEKSLK